MKKIITLALICILGLTGCSEAGAEKWDMIPMVMVDGTLYLDTGHNNTEVRKCGTPDGKITSTVEGTEKPTKDNQSNFGSGYGYQYGATEGTIEIYMNDAWRIFATEEVRQQIQFPEEESAEERVEGERLEAICYNGECYYGLMFGIKIREGEEPEGFTYLGKISSIVEGYKSPTEELSATIWEVGDEVYHYTDEKGKHYFCTPIGNARYSCIYDTTTKKPGYYD